MNIIKWMRDYLETRPDQFVVGGEMKTQGTEVFIHDVIADRQINIPLGPFDFNYLRDASVESHFGKKDKTLYDPKIRKSREIDLKKLSKTFKIEIDFDPIREKIAQELNLNSECFILIEPFKINFYKKGDFFQDHKDSEDEYGHNATLAISLSNYFTGGALQIRHAGQHCTWVGRAEEPFVLPWCLFFTDCTHSVAPVEGGERAILLCKVKISSWNYQVVDGFDKAFMNDLNSNPVILLDHLYAPHNLRWDLLKGRDRYIADLAATLDKNGIHSFLAPVKIQQQWESDDWDDGQDFYEKLLDPDFKCNVGKMYFNFQETIPFYWMSHPPFPGEKNEIKNIVLHPKNIISLNPTAAYDYQDMEDHGQLGNQGVYCDFWFERSAFIVDVPHLHAMPRKDSFESASLVEWGCGYWDTEPDFNLNSLNLL